MRRDRRPRIAPRFDGLGGSRHATAFGASWLEYARFEFPIRLNCRRPAWHCRRRFSYRSAIFEPTLFCLCLFSFLGFFPRRSTGIPVQRTKLLTFVFASLRCYPAAPRNALARCFPHCIRVVFGRGDSLTSTPQELIMNARRHTV